MFQKKYSHSICCPTASAPKSCIWRGSGGDCNGQCHEGEAAIFNSSWGGSPTESNTNKCSRGFKQFCCQAGDWNQVIDGCRWTGCGGSCSGSEVEVSDRYNSASCTVFAPHQKYCCPPPVKLSNCHWVGSQPDCPNAKCGPSEVAIDRNPQGRGYPSCSCESHTWPWSKRDTDVSITGGRQKIDCCTVTAPPPQHLQCPNSACKYDPTLCSISDDGGFTSVNGFQRKRNTDSICELDPASCEVDALSPTSTLEERGPARYPKSLIGAGYYLTWTIASYPSRGQLWGAQARLRGIVHRWLRMRIPDCGNVDVIDESVDTSNPPTNGESEHPIDVCIFDPALLKAIADMRSGSITHSVRRTTRHR